MRGEKMDQKESIIREACRQYKIPRQLVDELIKIQTDALYLKSKTQARDLTLKAINRALEEAKSI